MQPLKRLILALAVIFLVPAVMLTGCGGSDGSPAASDPCAEFTPSVGSSPGTVTTTVVTGSTTCDILVLSVNVAGVDNVFTAGFKMQFPTNLLNFLNADDTNSAMRQNGVDVVTVVQDVQQVGPNLSETLISISRTSNTDPGVNFGDTPESLLQLLFSRGAGTGAGSISYIDDELLDDQTPPAPITGVTWHGGTITVN